MHFIAEKTGCIFKTNSGVAQFLYTVPQTVAHSNLSTVESVSEGAPSCHLQSLMSPNLAANYLRAMETGGPAPASTSARKQRLNRVTPDLYQHN